MTLLYLLFNYLTNKYLANKIIKAKSSISTFNHKYNYLLKKQRKKKAKK